MATGNFPIDRNGCGCFLLSFFAVMNLCAGQTLSSPKPVPRMQVVPMPYDQASFQRDGVELTRYHFGPGLHRPFLFPVSGPSGRSLTRMGHPHAFPVPGLRPFGAVSDPDGAPARPAIA
ncbi:MAG: DUF6807 family protein [Planctomycetota bacterium]